MKIRTLTEVFEHCSDVSLFPPRGLTQQDYPRREHQ